MTVITGAEQEQVPSATSPEALLVQDSHHPDHLPQPQQSRSRHPIDHFPFPQLRNYWRQDGAGRGAWKVPHLSNPDFVSSCELDPISMVAVYVRQRRELAEDPSRPWWYLMAGI